MYIPLFEKKRIEQVVRGMLGLPRFVPLSTILTSTSFDGDAFSTTAKTLIDLSATFGVPAGIKAVLVSVTIRDSASATGSDYWITLSPNNTANNGPHVRCGGLVNDAYTTQTLPITCDANGDIYYQIAASGAGTFDVYLQVWGYWI